MDGNEDRPPAVRMVQALLDWVGEGRELDDAGRVGIVGTNALAEQFAAFGELYADADSGKAMVRADGISIPLGLLLWWAQLASLLRHIDGRLEPAVRAAEDLKDADVLRTKLFNALFKQKFGVNIAPESPSLVAVNYEWCFDTLLATLFIYQDGSPMNVSVVSELVRMRLLPRELMDPLSRSEAVRHSAAALSDLRIILECLAALGMVDLNGDLVEITDAGRVEIARRHGTPLPGDELWRIRIELLDLDGPPVWRAVELAPSTTMSKLGRVLESTMGWGHSRTHRFHAADGKRCDEREVLADVLSPGRELIFTYDHGWRHRVAFELATVAQAGRNYPYCIDGAGTCPYEDIGGPAEWAAFTTAPAEHVDRLAALGLEQLLDFDPDAFDLDNRNMVLRSTSWPSRLKHLDSVRNVSTIALISRLCVYGVLMKVLDDLDLLLTMVASGVVDAYEVVEDEGALPVPYPPNLQRALDRCGAVRLARGMAPPQRVPELLSWCAGSLGDFLPLTETDISLRAMPARTSRMNPPNAKPFREAVPAGFPLVRMASSWS